MKRTLLSIVVFTLLTVQPGSSKQFNLAEGNKALDEAQKLGKEFPICSQYAINILNGATGALIDVVPTDDACKDRYPMCPNGLPNLTKNFIDEVLVDKWGYRKRVFNPNSLSGADKDWIKANIRRLDICLIIGIHLPNNKIVNHIGILLGGWVDFFGIFDVYFTGANDYMRKTELFWYARKYQASEVWILCRPENDQLGECKALKERITADSTMKKEFEGAPGWGAVRHQWVCCWHENLPNTWPWYADSSGYACLSWQENNGTTWDTLISPRIDLAACSSVVFKQMTYSNLLHGGNKTIEIRGSTDDGATWPYLIGTDTTTEAALSWATNQRNVRIAWIYKGPVQTNRFWCIDEIWIMAKPARRHDICVSEARPWKIISQGKNVSPCVHVTNYGENYDTVSVTVKIGNNLYNQTKEIHLFPYTDTSLFFPAWTATPGTHSLVAFASLDSDYYRGNDTLTLTFQVAADTWVSMFPVYNGGVQTGSCITSTGNETLYCVTGKSKFFAKYLISQNLWKTRRPTPEFFGQGGSITYANGNYLYALRGLAKKTFYRYNISSNSWTALADAPDKIGSGGALAYGGSGYIYALRGNNKKSFYRYNIANNTWQTLAETPGKIDDGGSLVWAGGDFLYA